MSDLIRPAARQRTAKVTMSARVTKPSAMKKNTSLSDAVFSIPMATTKATIVPRPHDGSNSFGAHEISATHEIVIPANRGRRFRIGAAKHRFVVVLFLVVFAAVAHAQRATTTLDRHVHDLINAERTKRGVPALAWDARLAAIARAHSEDMARRHFFNHVNPDGEDPTARGRRAGYDCRKKLSSTEDRIGLGENLYEISGNAPVDVARQSVKGWMNSPGHRQNILERGYSKSGIGIAVSGDQVFVTQLFC